MKLKNPLPPPKMQVHLLSIPCRFHVLAGAHGICQGLTAAQGQRSHYLRGQKEILNLNMDSMLLFTLAVQGA